MPLVFVLEVRCCAARRSMLTHRKIQATASSPVTLARNMSWCEGVVIGSTRRRGSAASESRQAEDAGVRCREVGGGLDAHSRGCSEGRRAGRGPDIAIVTQRNFRASPKTNAAVTLGAPTMATTRHLRARAGEWLTVGKGRWASNGLRVQEWAGVGRGEQKVERGRAGRATLGCAVGQDLRQARQASPHPGACSQAARRESVGTKRLETRTLHQCWGRLQHKLHHAKGSDSGCTGRLAPHTTLPARYIAGTSSTSHTSPTDEPSNI